MFVWMSAFQKSLAHTDFNMFVDEWTGANENPVFVQVDRCFQVLTDKFYITMEANWY